MTSDPKPNLNLTIYNEAAEWLIELREGDVDAGTRERLDSWFRASPEHIRAYLELSSIWEEGADSDLDRTHSTQDLIARARATSNVIPLGASVIESRDNTAESTATKTPAAIVLNDRSSAPIISDDSPDRAPSVYHRFWRRGPVWIAAAVSACVIGSVGGLYLYGERNRTLATDTGEQRFVSLVDGSTVELNSRSRVRIRFSDNERDVDLIEGQALFHVAHDAARPFIVHSGTTLVRAVGTQFDVYRKESGTTVTVVEGRVAVLSPMLTAQSPNQINSLAASQHTLPNVTARDSSPGSPPGSASSSSNSHKVRSNSPDPAAEVANSALTGSPTLQGSDPSGSAVYLSAGEQITVSSGVPPRATHADASVATAWTQHELVFDSTPLSDVAQDFNRYNTRQLIVTDPALKGFHITGVFSSADPASLLKFLRAQRDLVVDETDDGIRVSKK
jgi:transmembrane sensor